MVTITLGSGATRRFGGMPNNRCSGPALALLTLIVWVVRPGRAAELHVRPKAMPQATISEGVAIATDAKPVVRWRDE